MASECATAVSAVMLAAAVSDVLATRAGRARAGSQVAALMGKEGDATPFTDVTVDNISAALQRCGYQSRGWEVMYSGHTGRQLAAQIFLNPTYYQRLKHMARAPGAPARPAALTRHAREATRGAHARPPPTCACHHGRKHPDMSYLLIGAHLAVRLAWPGRGVRRDPLKQLVRASLKLIDGLSTLSSAEQTGKINNPFTPERLPLRGLVCSLASPPLPSCAHVRAGAGNPACMDHPSSLSGSAEDHELRRSVNLSPYTLAGCETLTLYLVY